MTTIGAGLTTDWITLTWNAEPLFHDQTCCWSGSYRGGRLGVPVEVPDVRDQWRASVRKSDSDARKPESLLRLASLLNPFVSKEIAMKTATKVKTKKVARELKNLRTSDRDKKSAERHRCCRCCRCF